MPPARRHVACKATLHWRQGDTPPRSVLFPRFDFQRRVEVAVDQAFGEIAAHEGLDPAEALVLGDVDELVAEDA